MRADHMYHAGQDWGEEIAEGRIDWETDVTFCSAISGTTGLLTRGEGEAGEDGENEEGGVAREGFQHFGGPGWDKGSE